MPEAAVEHFERWDAALVAAGLEVEAERPKALAAFAGRQFDPAELVVVCAQRLLQPVVVVVVVVVVVDDAAAAAA